MTTIFKSPYYLIILKTTRTHFDFDKSNFIETLNYLQFMGGGVSFEKQKFVSLHDTP